MYKKLIKTLIKETNELEKEMGRLQKTARGIESQEKMEIYEDFLIVKNKFHTNVRLIKLNMAAQQLHEDEHGKTEQESDDEEPEREPLAFKALLSIIDSSAEHFDWLYTMSNVISDTIKHLKYPVKHPVDVFEHHLKLAQKALINLATLFEEEEKQ